MPKTPIPYCKSNFLLQLGESFEEDVLELIIATIFLPYLGVARACTSEASKLLHSVAIIHVHGKISVDLFPVCFELYFLETRISTYTV